MVSHRESGIILIKLDINRLRNIPFQWNEMITVTMPENPEVIDYFKLYITDAVTDQVWGETQICSIIYT